MAVPNELKDLMDTASELRNEIIRLDLPLALNAVSLALWHLSRRRVRVAEDWFRLAVEMVEEGC